MECQLCKENDVHQTLLIPWQTHPELSGCITTLKVRNTWRLQTLCSSGHLDVANWAPVQSVFVDTTFNLRTKYQLVAQGCMGCNVAQQFHT